jgi:cobalamin synthase
MRLLQLARAAWEAEGLHLRRLVRARGIQAGYGAAAALFLLMMVFMLHIAAFGWLQPQYGHVGAPAIIALGDAVIVGMLLFLASRAAHDPVAEEAKRVRQEAVQQLSDGAARVVVLAPLLKSQNAKKGLLGAALTALVVGLLSRR